MADTTKSRYTLVLLVSAVLAVAYFAEEAVCGTITLLRSDLGIPTSQSSWLYSVGHILSPVVALTAGVAVDRYGVGLPTVAAMCLMFVAAILYTVSVACWSHRVFSGNFAFPAMFLSRFLSGIGFNLLEVFGESAIYSYLSDSSTPSLSMACGFQLGMTEMGAGLGTFAFPSMGEAGGLAVAASLEPLMLLVGLIAAMAMRTAVTSLSGVDDSDSDDEEDLTLDMLCNQGAIGKFRAIPAQAWLPIFVEAFVYVATMVYQVFLTDYLHTEWGFSLSVAGCYNGMLQVLAMFFCPLAGWMLQDVHRCGFESMGKCKFQFTMQCTTISMIVGATSTAMAHLLAYYHTGPVAFGLLLMGVGYSLVPVACNTCLGRLPKKLSPYAAAANNFLDAIVMFVGPIVVGHVRDATGSYKTVNILMGCMALLGLVCAIMLHRLGPPTDKINPVVSELESCSEEEFAHLNSENVQSR